MKNYLKISPVGGVKQIGSNCTLIETSSQKLLIDCGILFPNEGVFDINYLIPDLSAIDNIDTIVITHGHEDHIGAVSHFIEAFPSAEIYAPRFAKELIQFKLSQRKISKKINILTKQDFGDVNIEAFHVNHSIPDTKGLLITHKKLELAITFISDFKIDKNNQYEAPFDFKILEDASKSYSKRIALLDSTNILSKNIHTPSEMDLIEPLKNIIKGCDGTTFVTTFSSNIHRIQTLINIARELGRVVIPYGRSMQRYIETALETEFLTGLDIIKDADDKSVKKKKIVILSGCQGEFRGALKRVVSKQDSRFKFAHGDYVIFSSKAIPGNEKEVSLIYNDIVEQGVELFTPDNNLIHASGHPGREDLKEVYHAFKPTHAFPIHGESLFLKEHVNFIYNNKLADNAQMILNGDEIIVSDNIKVINKDSHPEPILIHGKDLPIERAKISERRKIATQGLILISFSKESINKFKPTFEITTQGLPEFIESELPEFESVLLSEFQALKKAPMDEKKEKIRVLTRRYFGNILGYRPVAVIHIC
ncbi:ribonuclease J [Bacteriovorax sp. Seq25_V]|uniref:ribonuclease J n=1 Tax=Bacteriovorax sp. Seq25_V TaxID=1201288 RepID=UPI000389E6F1|nr:ribonuclease J [Bacteriovorax sp. Seq25_V]EQC43499.1 hypothetical protein M900_0147 [Bacteriovorax sp. Seq25_V]